MKSSEIEELQCIVRKRDWSVTRSWLKSERLVNSGTYFSVEAIYLLIEILLERKQTSSTDVDNARSLLASVYLTSSEHFKNESEYLFFTGYFISLCDWCFGMDDAHVAYEMVRRAKAADPENRLYAWGYAYLMKTIDIASLSAQLASDAEFLSVLSKKGSAGAYMAEIIRSSPAFLELP